MSYKYFYLLLFINVILASSQTIKFTYLDEDKAQAILDYLTTKYKSIAILHALDTNPVFPIHIEPEYEGRAKQLYDQIIQLKINIEDMRRKGVNEFIIAQAEAYSKKTQEEFDKIKEPFITKSINKSLYPLLSKAKDAYIAIIMDYIQGDTELVDLVNVIMIAIINS